MSFMLLTTLGATWDISPPLTTPPFVEDSRSTAKSVLPAIHYITFDSVSW